MNDDVFLLYFAWDELLLNDVMLARNSENVSFLCWIEGFLNFIQFRDFMDIENFNINDINGQ